MNWTNIGSWIVSFSTKHEEALGLFALAMAVTMRPKLPWPFILIEPLEWCYEWLHDGLLTFVSMRGPAHSESSAQEKIVVDEKGKTTESTMKIESSATIPSEAGRTATNKEEVKLP